MRLAASLLLALCAGCDAPAGRDAGPIEDDAGAPPRRVPVLLMVGDEGRALLSCDDGVTFDVDVRETPYGDPAAWRARGLLFAGGAAFREQRDSFGRGVVERSFDGVRWEELYRGELGGGVASDGALVIIAAADALRAPLPFEQWSPAGDLDLGFSPIRSAAGGPFDGGRLLVVGDRGVRYSSDGGASWRVPAYLPGRCGGEARFERDLGLLVGRGTLCVSVDGGTSWLPVEVPWGAQREGPFAGSGRLHAWTPRTYWTSEDGLRWHGVEREDAPRYNETFAVHPTSGILVGADGADDAQEILRGLDGARLTPLPEGAFPRGPRLRHAAFGELSGEVPCAPAR